MFPILSVTERRLVPALFARLTDDERRALAPYLHTQHYRRGAFLFHVGEVADQLFWIYQGIVKVSAIMFGWRRTAAEHLLAWRYLWDDLRE
jgi:hypothetical protein